MTDDATAALRAELGPAAAGKLPDLSAVPPAAMTALVGALRDAKKNQKAQLQKSADESLRLVPALLRPAVRKVLFG